MRPLRLTFLGTRGGIAIRSARHHRHSFLLVQHGGARVMIDGESPAGGARLPRAVRETVGRAKNCYGGSIATIAPARRLSSFAAVPPPMATPCPEPTKG